jgi:hypothetical protein
MGKRFQGSTGEAGGQFLGADFWKKGTRIEGQVTGSFQTANGLSWSLRLKKAVKINGNELSDVSIGNMKGFLMALRAAGVPDQELLAGDAVVIECTGTTPTDKGNDQVNFKVLVDRP